MTKVVLRHVREQWFLACLLITLGVGLGFGSSLDWLVEAQTLKAAIVVTVMFLMAWPLETRLLTATLRKPYPALLASLLNMGLIPLLAGPLSVPLGSDLGAGLIAMAVAPCTLATAAVWTRRAGGNDATALLTTVMTNATCFVITPLWVFFLLGHHVTQLSFSEMMVRLLLLVLLPMLLAQLSRLNGGIARAASARRVQMSVLAQLGVLAMVLVGAVQTHVRLLADESSVGWPAFFLLLLFLAFLHFGVLALGVRLSRWLRFSRAEQIAVGFASSQKTLMIGLVICFQLGVSILPLVLYHTMQLIGDTLIADRYRRHGSGGKGVF